MSLKKNEIFFQVGGAIFFGWASYNTFLDIERYGIGFGLYWWFCNLATFAIGIGLLLRWRDLIAAFIAIAVFTQIFWIIDNLSMVFFHRLVFGLVNSMYQPGLPMDEFISVHYHYFTIPVAILALIWLPREGKNHTHRIIALVNPFIFLISCFAFSPAQNINCIHSACFKAVDWSGPKYSISFWLVLFVIHHLVAWWIEKKLVPIGRRPLTRWRTSLAMGGVCALAVGCVAIDVSYKLSLPRFSCADPSEKSGMHVICKYTRDYEENTFLLTYWAVNASEISQTCSLTAKDSQYHAKVHEELSLGPNETREMVAILPNPTQTTRAQIVSDCKDAERQPSQNQYVYPE